MSRYLLKPTDREERREQYTTEDPKRKEIERLQSGTVETIARVLKVNEQTMVTIGQSVSEKPIEPNQCSY